MMKLWSMVLVAMLVVAHGTADAKRMGGGQSVGKQSSNVTQREAVRSPAQNTPQNAATQNAAAKPAAPAPAAAPAKKPWGAMLGGLAAGLGLAWLANSLGLGAAFGQFMLFALLALVIMVVVGMVMRARRASADARTSPQNSPFAFQGAAPAGAAAGAGAESAPLARPYNPEKVGNDASARPWEQNHQPLASGSGSMIGSALSGSQNWGVPEGFDAEGFLTAAKRNFVTLQSAWDRSDIASLRSMMTDEMLTEIRGQLSEREAQRPGQPNQTDVVMIDAQLLGIEDLGNDYMASVEFSGMIREDASAGPTPFREVWNMTKPKSGNSGWLVAGVQALQ